MRSRSVTLYNLDEDLSLPPAEEQPEQSSELSASEETSSPLPTNRGSRNISAKARLKQEKKLAKLARSHAEVWQENETSIVLKMLDDSVRTRDNSRMTALQKSLLDIERTGGGSIFEKNEDSENELPMLPPSEFSLGPSIDMILEEPEKGSRNHQPTRSTSGSSGFSTVFSAAEQEYLQKAIKQNLKHHDVQINITIVGNGMTGKTSVTNALVGSKFEINTPRSTGYLVFYLYFDNSLDSKVTFREYKGKKVKFKIIDTDDDKGKEFIRKVYYDMSSAIIILYDVTNQESFNDTEFWINSVKTRCSHNPLILLVGNKTDEKGRRVVSEQMAQSLASQHGIAHFETSANDQTLIEKLAAYITAAVLEPEQSNKKREEEEKMRWSP